jgi:hypothetical protein
VVVVGAEGRARARASGTRRCGEERDKAKQERETERWWYGRRIRVASAINHANGFRSSG